jgi:hypothetical protein
MARCSYCGQETELHEGGMPICVACSNRLTGPNPGIRSIHTRLIEDLADASAHFHSVTRTRNQIIDDVPSGLRHPDGAQRIRSIAHELSVSKERLARAHSRLADFLNIGAIPEDLLH